MDINEGKQKRRNPVAKEKKKEGHRTTEAPRNERGKVYRKLHITGTPEIQ